VGGEETSEAIYCSEGIRVLRAGDLRADGWKQRTVGDRTRIEELQDLYSTLGFETATTNLDPSTFGEACTTCAVSACTEYVALFTRPAKGDS